LYVECESEGACFFEIKGMPDMLMRMLVPVGRGGLEALGRAEGQVPVGQHAGCYGGGVPPVLVPRGLRAKLQEAPDSFERLLWGAMVGGH
jgi:hypothetical protein